MLHRSQSSGAFGSLLIYDKCTSEGFSRYEKSQSQSLDLNMLERSYHLNHLILKNLVPMNLNKETLVI